MKLLVKALALYSLFFLSSYALAGEIGREQWQENVSIKTLTSNKFDSVYIQFSRKLPCGNNPGALGAYIIPQYVGKAKEMMSRTLLSAHLAGRQIDLALLQWQDGAAGITFCVVKRIRMH